MKNIVWLASYPKSGNTWLRLFLSALMNNDQLKLNEFKSDGIFSSRSIFSSFTDLDSTYLTFDEVNRMIPHVYQQLSKENEHRNIFLKIHDAYSFNTIPSGNTKCAIYLVRNPLDIVASFANHLNKNIQQIINFMIDDNAWLVKQNNNENDHNYFPLFIGNWSYHVESWAFAQLPFPVKVIKYEDMVKNPLSTFTEIVDFIGIRVSPHDISKAIQETHFNNLRKKEAEKGFSESSKNGNPFFRFGKAGRWKIELTNEQAECIIKQHAKTMSLFDYTY
ncbi:sulfotransferase domain-containing protein [Sediminibacterium sp.]|uniref:sulfotransferase domain-containing protein n=1 Tax=Sediminibacterium sp. TaxID=1917865 RepID=UPI003F6EC407